MRLICRTAFLAAVVSTLACHDVTAPPPSLPAAFQLVDINGRAVPYVPPIPEGQTVFASYIQLDGAGNATLDRFYSQMGTDTHETLTYTYEISGNQITFASPCPANALCAGPPKGTISGSRLSLEVNFDGPHPATYRYRLMAFN